MDWDVAVGTAVRLMPSGPDVPRGEAAEAVRSLRRFSAEAETYVREVTGLGEHLPVVQGDVVDRPAWVRGAAQGLADLTDAAMLTAGAAELRQSDLFGALSSRSAGMQAGVVLSYLGTKVLGQFDPYGPPHQDGQVGRLLLVAPNIVAAQRALGVPGDDFRMWVCLHEQTHRVQFAAAPWLAAHLQEKTTELTTALFDKSDSLPERLRTALAAALPGRNNDDGPAGRPAVSPDPVVTAVAQDPAQGAGGASGDDDAPVTLQTGSGAAVGTGTTQGPGGLLGALQDDEDRARLSHLTAVMSLLEGYANVVMDAVDAEVVETVKTIRRRFNARGDRRSPLERFVRRLIGMDAKMRQYADGQKFVDAAVAELGMDGFNVVWDDPALLPTEAEIHAPDMWVARMRREA